MRGRILLATLALGPTLAGCSGESPKDPDDLTFIDMHGALVRPGMVFHALFELSPEGDQRPSYEAWYSPERGLGRYAYYSDPGELRSIEVITPEREISFDVTDGYLSDDPIPTSIAPKIPFAAAPLRSYYFGNEDNNPDVEQSETNNGVVIEDGRTLIHLTNESTYLNEGHERPAGARFTFDVFFDAESHMPVRSELRLLYPDQPPGGGALVTTFTKTEFVEAASLPADHFDPDSLASMEVTLDEAIEQARAADFAVFWLGKSVPADWVTPQGQRYSAAELAAVQIPGVPGGPEPGNASLRYSMLPHFSGSMLSLIQSVDSRFAPRRADQMADLRAAGNIEPIPGRDGYIYAEYAPRGSCSYAQAQTDPGCRMFPDPVHGAVVVTNGTVIHLQTERIVQSDSGQNTNPFSDRETLLRLVGELRPIGE